jgi:hypothetical protein
MLPSLAKYSKALPESPPETGEGKGQRMRVGMHMGGRINRSTSVNMGKFREWGRRAGGT